MTVWLAGYVVWSAGLLALWLAALALLEGVSHFGGEGQILSPDSSAGRRDRLTFVGTLVGEGVGAVALGALARAWGRPDRPRRLSRLSGDGLLFLGGLGLFYGVLVLAASIHAQPEDDALYLWLGGAALAAGLVMAPAGAWLRRHESSDGRVRPGV
jgi:hypothetical protein